MDAAYPKQLRAALDGQRESIDWIMTEERPWLLAVCKRLLRGSGVNIQADDLAQECCLQFVSAGQSLRLATQGQLRAWLIKVSRNKILDNKKRRRNVGNALAMDLPAPSPDRYWPIHSRTVHELRKALPPRQDAAIMLRDYCNCSFELVAKVLNCNSIPAARALRARAFYTMSRPV